MSRTENIPVRESGSPTTRERVRGFFKRHPGAREILIFLGALAIYQVSRAFVVGDPLLAQANANSIVAFERANGLFFEGTIQRWMVDQLGLASVMNYFYMSAHWVVTTAFFVWLFTKRRKIYPLVRNAFLIANGIAIIIYMAFPVAPPRLFEGDGLIGTLSTVSDIDLQSGTFASLFNPYAAVPSMHFGYALMIGVIGLMLLRHWPLKIAAIAYPGVVFLMIVGTANHYVLDAVAGGLVLMAGFALVGAWVMARRADDQISRDSRTA